MMVFGSLMDDSDYISPHKHFQGARPKGRFYDYWLFATTLCETPSPINFPSFSTLLRKRSPHLVEQEKRENFPNVFTFSPKFYKSAKILRNGSQP